MKNQYNPPRKQALQQKTDLFKCDTLTVEVDRYHADKQPSI